MDCWLIALNRESGLLETAIADLPSLRLKGTTLHQDPNPHPNATGSPGIGLSRPGSSKQFAKAPRRPMEVYRVTLRLSRHRGWVK
jgi:hypothetical protein